MLRSLCDRADRNRHRGVAVVAVHHYAKVETDDVSFV